MELIQVPVFWEGQNNPEYLHVLNEYLTLTKLPNTEFIGGMPVTLENDCFKQLFRIHDQKLVYYITLKVDGERYLLFLSSNGVYFIDRSLNFYFFQLPDGQRLPRITTKPFLFDGELVKFKNDTFEFLIFDVLFYNGESFMEKNYYTRYDLVNYCIDNLFKEYPSGNLIFSSKQWFPVTDILKTDDIYDYVNNSTNKSRKNKLVADGLILQPFDTPYVAVTPWNRHDNVQFKWKPLEHQTMDFKIKIIKPNEWQLLTKADYPFTIPGSGTPATYKPTDANKRNIFDGDVAEFTYRSGKFKLIRSRPNKTANSLGSIMSIWNFINSPFTLDKIKPAMEHNLKNILSVFSTNYLITCILKNGLIFNKNEIKNIKSVYDNFQNGLELEFRIIKKGKKDSSVDKFTFYYLLDYLSKNFNESISNTTVDTVKDNNKSTYTLDGKLITNQTKTRITQIFSDNSKFFNLQFKLALSNETVSNVIIPFKSNNIRIKNRHSFNINSLWRLDCTIVKSGYSSIADAESKNETYEIECEYLGPSDINFDTFLKSISQIFILILQNTTYC
uniref:mRNA 5'-phosphatase n=1 Tax=viral metagenome TaxID=1070528 RepID=A0A6C0I7X9_9ZZZZ